MLKRLRKIPFAFVLYLLLGGAIAAPPITAADKTAKAAEAAYSTSPISIWLESEPRLQAPLRTLLSSSPQAFIIDFPEPMDRESVAQTIQKQSAAADNPRKHDLAWTFQWTNDHRVRVQVTITAVHSNADYYLLGDYRINVNGSETRLGQPIADAPIFAVSIQAPSQLWRYSSDGEAREWFATIDEPYSFLNLKNDDRYLLGFRFVEYCECDAVLKKLYALYDLQENQLIRYPVNLQTTYRGNGSFVADRRGFFYEQPEPEVEVPASAEAFPIHVDGYVHGASFSKDRNSLFMAVGQENQEKALTILLYSLQTGSVQILEESVQGWVPEDQGYGRRMPISFHDEGEEVYFMLQDRESFREIRYQYSWDNGTITDWDIPIPEESWYGFSASSDLLYRHYANGGLYRGSELVSSNRKLPYWSEHWLNGTHTVVYTKGELDRSGQKQYTGQIQLFDADLLEEKTLYSGLYYESDIIGSSKDGKWIYVSAREPVNRASPLPVFGEGDGKLLAQVKPNAAVPITLFADEIKMKLEHAPLSVDDYALFLPLREVLEALGWSIQWQPEEQMIIGKKTDRLDRVFAFKVGSDKARFNGKEIDLPLAPKLFGDTTYLYAGILQKLGMNLDWDDSKRILFIRQTPETGGVLLPGESKYEGGLIGDIPSGKGMLFDKFGRLIYDGEFKDGKYHGQGVLYSDSGRPIYTGLFENGDIYRGAGGNSL